MIHLIRFNSVNLKTWVSIIFVSFAFACGFENEINELKKKAEKGDSQAQFVLGSLYFSGHNVPQDTDLGVKYFQLSAENGFAPAQGTLGVFYEQGICLPKNLDDSIKSYQLAADQGLDIAQNAIGMAYYTGKGHPQDFQKALKWFQLAADQGLAAAQSILGEMYEKGSGIPIDLVEAYKWYSLSKVYQKSDSGMDPQLLSKYGLGDPSSKEEEMLKKDEVALKMNPDQVAEGERRAIQFSKKVDSN